MNPGASSSKDPNKQTPDPGVPRLISRGAGWDGVCPDRNVVCEHAIWSEWRARIASQPLPLRHLQFTSILPLDDHTTNGLSFLQADAASPNCDSPTCRSSFGIFLRRHHCRHCGHVFCSSHTPHNVPLDQEARFHPDGVPSRACDLCWSAYSRWEEARTDRLNKIQNNIDSGSIDERSNPEDMENSQESGRAALQPNLGQTPDVAASVPRDWNWSTF